MNNKPKLYMPSWSHPKCKILKTWDEIVVSGNASGIRTRVLFLNSKGQEQLTTKWVKWDEK